MKKIKEKISIWKRYLKEAPKNIKNHEKFKQEIIDQEKTYMSKYNELDLHSDPEKTVLWKWVQLTEAQERYWDYYAKQQKIIELVRPVVEWFQKDLEWGEYLTYEIAHVADEDNPNAVIMTYAVIFNWTPVPLIEEGMSYNDYLHKYKRIKMWRNGLIAIIGITVLSIISMIFLL